MRHPLLTLVLFSAAFTSAGCTDDGSSLFIVGVGGLNDMCIVDTTVAVANGAVDLDISPRLAVFPVFASQVRSRVSANAANPADIHVQNVEVRLESLGGETLSLGGLANPFTVPTSAFLEGFSGGGEVPSAAGAVEVLPVGYAQEIFALLGGSRTSPVTVLAALRPIGRTNGTVEVEGNYNFRYPLTVCAGCLSRCVVADEEAFEPCNPGQNDLRLIDDPVLCP